VRWRRPTILAAAGGGAALALYVATLAPGLIAIEDTPKFQFVGRILGTAHPPGYPFYVVLSHFFGLLPIGNLAWRINLLSAVCAALTVVFYQLAAVELGVAPAIAALGGLGLATGAGFWFAATIAEVYSLHGCLVAVMTYALFRWRRTGRPRWFFAAIAAFSIGLGHHTSIVTIGPAVAMFAVACAPRFAVHPKTVAAVIGLFALGFSQYLFVLLRTRQGAWGESPASNLHELFDVVRGARWAAYLAPMSLETVASRAPNVATVLIGEISWPVLVAAVAGIAVMTRRDRPSLALLLGAVAGVAGFSVFFAGQTEGFLQPAYFHVWLLAAVGIASLLTAAPGAGRHATTVACVLLAGLVAWHLSMNLEARDLSHRRFEMRYFDALSRQLPAHSGLLAEDFLVDRMVLYERFSQSTFAERDILAQVEAVPDRVAEYASRGYRLFAFRTSATRLRPAGIVFDHAPWPMEYGPLRQYLTDQPRGTIVAIAVPAIRLPGMLEQGALLDAIGGRVPKASWSNLAAIGVVGGSGGLQAQAEKDSASVFAGRGLAIGRTQSPSPADILAEAVYDEAAIRNGSRVIARSRQPVAALWTPRGSFVGAFALTETGMVPMPESPVSIHRLRGIQQWTALGPSSVDLTRVSAGGHLMIRQTASPAVIYAGRRGRMLVPRLFGELPGLPPLAVEEFTGGSRELQEATARDRLSAAATLMSMARVYRIELPKVAGSYHLVFGGIPDTAIGRPMVAEAPGVYALDLSSQLETIDAVTDRLHVARDHHQLFLAQGWSPISADETGNFSMITGADGEILLPCDAGACASVDLQMWTDNEGSTVGLAINGAALPDQPLRAGWNMYRWTVSSAAVHAGMNSLVVRPSRPVRLADVWIARTDRRAGSQAEQTAR
jgi:hypothetical protein